MNSGNRIEIAISIFGITDKLSAITNDDRLNDKSYNENLNNLVKFRVS